MKSTYTEVRAKLEQQMKKNPSKQPTCYERGSFVDTTANPAFSMRKVVQPMPVDFCQPTFFVWLPHILQPEIHCPECERCGRKKANGRPIVLWKKGWPKAPRRITDLDQSIWIIGYRYRCSNTKDCKRTFMSWSPAILRCLKPLLSAQFTHHLTYRSGLTDTVVALLRSSITRGISVKSFTESIRQLHIRRYENKKLQYLHALMDRKQSALSFRRDRFPHFGDFDDQDGYSGFVPGAYYFGEFYTQVVESHAHEMDQHMSMLPARVLEMDHSFKVSPSNIAYQKILTAHLLYSRLLNI